MDSIQPPLGSVPAESHNALLRRRALIILVVLLILSGVGFAAVQLWRTKDPGTVQSPTPTPGAPISTSERSQVSNPAEQPSFLKVTELVTERAVLGAATAQTLLLAGDLTTGGNVIVTGAVTAANFQGNGAGLANVNASLLGGQPRAYYEGLAGSTAGAIGNLTANAALRNANNTFTATNTFDGPVAINGALTLGAPLAVPQGGTGVAALAANGVVIGQGAGGLATVVAGGAGECLMSTGGAPVFAACPGGGGAVTSVNGLTGALTIANATGVGSTITIDDATTGAKGIASFNATNFTVLSGAVNTVQNINTGATPTFAGVNTNAITPSGALTVGATGQNFTLQGTAASTITATNGGNTTTVSFVAPTANRSIVMPNESGTVCLQGATTCGFAPTTGGTGYIQNTTTLQTNANIAIQSAADASVSLLIKQRATQSADALRIVDLNDIPVLNVDAFGNTHVGRALTVDTYAAVGGPTDNGIALKVYTTSDSQLGLHVTAISSGQTGEIARFDGPNGRSLVYGPDGGLVVTGGSIQSANLLQVQTNTPTSVLTVGATGTTLFQNSTNSFRAFEVQNASGSNALFSVDTTNGRVSVNGFTSGAGATFNINGTTLFTGAAGMIDYQPPVGLPVPARIAIENLDPGAAGSILATGVLSSAPANARGIMLADARTISHQPTIGVLSPDQSDIFGLSWEGVNGGAFLKTEGASIGIRSGGTDLAEFLSNGNVGIGRFGGANTARLTLGDSLGPPTSVPGNGTGAVEILYVAGGKGGNTTGVTGQTGGLGASVRIFSGDGGDAPSGSTNGNGGSITLQGGAPGGGAGAAGNYGVLFLQNSGGKVAVGNGNATATGTLDVVAATTSTPGLVVSGRASQTADLFQLIANGPTTLFAVGPTGAVMSRNSANSLTAFEVQRADTTPILTVDTTNSKVVVAALDVSGDLTVNGHIVSGGGAPAIAAGAAACTSPTVNVAGTDTAGLITVTTGTGCGATGILATLTFNAAFGAAPRVTLTAAEANAAALGQIYVDSGTISTTAFDLSTGTASANTTTYKWYYQVIQ